MSADPVLMRQLKALKMNERDSYEKLTYVQEQIFQTLDGIKYRSNTYNKAELVEMLSDWHRELSEVQIDDNTESCGPPGGFNCDTEHAEELKDSVNGMIARVESEVKGVLQSLQTMRGRVEDL